jgi:DsbC/DsbD-like thiol-disulfide interchange protein
LHQKDFRSSVYLSVCSFVCLVHDFRFVAVLPNLNLKKKGLDKQIMLTIPEVNVLTFSVKVVA